MVTFIFQLTRRCLLFQKGEHFPGGRRSDGSSFYSLETCRRIKRRPFSGNGFLSRTTISRYSPSSIVSISSVSSSPECQVTRSSETSTSKEISVAFFDWRKRNVRKSSSTEFPATYEWLLFFGPR